MSIIAFLMVHGLLLIVVTSSKKSRIIVYQCNLILSEGNREKNKVAQSTCIL